ncbi:hypothetical protein [Agrococcus sp. SGAir0287]|uniref:hypothetical protein n=1 Tax=Agrococcus sp. SGAir0287 TaxID=2070347 RepID=UPI0010CD000A|nr:hypothetical protein [Agrococcus sp. SGAir0287]QCR18740.1 hypothetical protein C1N71_04135 [Agrococcus sp. SGAir0287]
MSARLAAALATTMLAAAALSGCVLLPPQQTIPTAHLADGDELAEYWDDVPEEVQGDASIVMTFTDVPAADDEAAWEALTTLEMEAGVALVDAGVGYLDGNGSDGVVYDVFFYGLDHEAMWDVVEPIYADAPIAWSSVTMWDSFEATEPAVELVR